MYHTLTKRIPLFVSLFLIIIIAGCAGSKPGVNISEKKYETDTSSIEVQTPEFKNFPDSEFEEKLNTDYENKINSWLKDFSGKSSENTPSGEKCMFRLKQELKFNSGQILSLVGDIYIFTEGIHGSSSRITKNIDTQRSIELHLSDLFDDDSYPTAINREINDILEKNPDEYHDLWEKPVLSSIHQEFFYLSNKGLVIFFPPYELSYYARGFVEFCIPYDELSGYLRPEYRTLSKM